MTTIKILLSTAALCVASAAFAQSSNTCSWLPKGDDGAGVIGKRYVEVGANLIDESHTSHNTFGSGFSANLPLVEGIDLSGGYHYSWFNHDPITIKSHNIGASATVYKTIENGVKPFVAVGLGYSWRDENLDDGWIFYSDNRNHHSNDTEIWGLTIGAEFPYKWIAVVPTITYNDDFQRKTKSSQEFVYSVEVNTWITRQVGIFVSGSYYDQQHVASRTFGVGVGARFHF